MSVFTVPYTEKTASSTYPVKCSKTCVAQIPSTTIVDDEKTDMFDFFVDARRQVPDKGYKQFTSVASPRSLNPY
jgi:hypothetical protein